MAGESIVRLASDCDVTDGRFRRGCMTALDALALYPGVKDALAKLDRRGTPQGVVTSLPGRFAEPLLERLGLAVHFSVVVHAGTVRTGKPSPAPLLEAARRMALDDLADVVYVGDTAKDAEAARRAGMRFAWAAYGYGGECPDHAVTLRAFSDVLAL